MRKETILYDYIYEYINLTLVLIKEIELGNTKPTEGNKYEYQDDGIDITYNERFKQYYVTFYYDSINIIFSDISNDENRLQIVEINKLFKLIHKFVLNNNKLHSFYDLYKNDVIKIENYENFNNMLELTEEEIFYLKLKYENIGDIIGC